jgi:hypothetical protein
MASILFIHRSVGENLIRDGGLYRLVREAGSPFTLADFNQNTGVLRSSQETRKTFWKFPGNDTKPADFAELFSFEKQQASDPTLTEIMNYDIIVIKSCYPNSNIKSREQLESIQGNYQSIVSFFNAQPTKKLVILTSPPLVPIKTDLGNAVRARTLATWLSGNKLASNVFGFNLFDELANNSTNTLKTEYRRKLPWNAHPNALASRTIAPKLAAFLKDIAASQ